MSDTQGWWLLRHSMYAPPLAIATEHNGRLIRTLVKMAIRTTLTLQMATAILTTPIRRCTVTKSGAIAESQSWLPVTAWSRKIEVVISSGPFSHVVMESACVQLSLKLMCEAMLFDQPFWIF